MTGRGHILIGVAVTTALLAGQVPPLTLAGAALAAGVTSTLPDIDHPNSLITHRLHMRLPFAHRGLTHSALILMVLGALAWFGATALPGALVLAAWLGYALHVAADVLTVEGVRLWWPLRVRVVAPVAVRTGGLGERVVVAAVIAVAGGIILAV